MIKEQYFSDDEDAEEVRDIVNVLPKKLDEDKIVKEEYSTQKLGYMNKA